MVGVGWVEVATARIDSRDLRRSPRIFSATETTREGIGRTGPREGPHQTLTPGYLVHHPRPGGRIVVDGHDLRHVAAHHHALRQVGARGRGEAEPAREGRLEANVELVALGLPVTNRHRAGARPSGCLAHPGAHFESVDGEDSAPLAQLDGGENGQVPATRQPVCGWPRVRGGATTALMACG